MKHPGLRFAVTYPLRLIGHIVLSICRALEQMFEWIGDEIAFTLDQSSKFHERNFRNKRKTEKLKDSVVKDIERL